MKKFLYWLAVIISITAMILAFSPLIQSHIANLSWSVILIVSAPGLLTVIATIFALKFRLMGGLMFLILSAVFGYFILSQLLSREYLIISVLYIIAGILFFILNKKEKIKLSNSI